MIVKKSQNLSYNDIFVKCIQLKPCIKRIQGASVVGCLLFQLAVRQIQSRTRSLSNRFRSLYSDNKTQQLIYQEWVFAHIWLASAAPCRTTLRTIKSWASISFFARRPCNFFSWSALHCTTTLSSGWCLSDEWFGLFFLMHYASCAHFYSGYRNIETQRACKM